MPLSIIFLLAMALHRSEGAGYNDTISCEAFPEVLNYTDAELQAEAEMFGRCVPFTLEQNLVTSPSSENPCNRFYTPLVDNIYLPSGRALDDIRNLNDFSASISLTLDTARPECRDVVTRAICYYFYPPCGNDTHFVPPAALCQDLCLFLITELCDEEWMKALQLMTNFQPILEMLQIQFIDCSDPGASLGSLPHCCSNAGIEILFPTGTEANATELDSSSTATTTAADSSSNTLVVALVSAITATLLIVVTVVAVTTTCCCLLQKSRGNNIILQFGTEPDMMLTKPDSTSSATPKSRYVPVSGLSPAGRARVASENIRKLSQNNLIIPGRHLKLLDTIGQGEFGVVYRGHLTGWQERVTAELVAIKTLKSHFSPQDVDDLMKESDKMTNFQHPNVLKLIGVCIDAGEAPYIVTPFMANGSLLAYLRRERPHLTIAEGAGAEIIAEGQRRLLSICLQISKGMCYLAEQKFVHRDLAARNCMMDQNLCIKVADFGLSEDIYSRNYFRQESSNEEHSVKLPIRWMALESLLDHVFTEKTDVWSYGVTCWEVFSLGHTPYPAIDPFALIKFLRNGERLEKPLNAACTEKVFELISQCWIESPEERTSFLELSQAVNSLLEGVAGYVDFSGFSGDTESSKTEDTISA